MHKSIQNILKGLLVIFLSGVTFFLLKQLLSPFLQLPAVLAQNYEPSIFSKNGLLLPSRIVMGVFVTIHLIVFVVFGRHVHQNVILRGLLCGASIASVWVMVFVENVLIYNDSFVPNILGGVRDFLWLTSTGLFASLIFAKPRESAGRRSRFDLLAIPMIGVLFAVCHGLQYYLTFPPLHQTLENPVSIIWLVLHSCSIGLIYYLFRFGIKVRNVLMKSLCFSFVIVGINWILVNSFILCEITLPFLDMFVRLLFDILGIFIGTLLFELIAKKFHKSEGK